MNVTCLNQEIESIQERAAPLVAERTDHHQRLFAVFQKIENALTQDPNSDPTEEANRIEALIEAQTVVIRTAAALPARTAKDLMYKLALWRWDAPDLDKPIEDMERADAIAYSAFRDLAVMLSDNSTLKDIDHSN